MRATLDHSRFSLVLDPELAWEAMWRAQTGVFHELLGLQFWERGSADLFAWPRQGQSLQKVQASATARFSGHRFLVIWWPAEHSLAPEVYVERSARSRT